MNKKHTPTLGCLSGCLCTLLLILCPITAFFITLTNYCITTDSSIIYPIISFVISLIGISIYTFLHIRDCRIEKAKSETEKEEDKKNKLISILMIIIAFLIGWDTGK
ncbi:MAG: hypothetical protein LBG58_04130 [Planctomycetaceae bacterium]|jgi:phosphate/sulfate permease|nr:hypothetical protein [Planctomycetaceae bacterium]